MEELRQVLNVIRSHNGHVRDRVDLVASNSWISQFVRLAMCSSLTNNYCVGLPGNRLYGGCEFIDIVERDVIRIAKRLFHAPHVVLQFLSGMQANVGAYNALLSRGDVIMAAPTRHGGHYSHTVNGPLRFFEPHIVPMPFDPDRYNIDLGKLADAVERERPRLMIVGWSEFLFPHPLAQVREICDAFDVRLMYDMSHVVGLIAGGVFQPDVMTYADIVTTSTGKSLHAPDHGMVMYRDPAYTAGIMDAVLPLLTSNTHPQEVAGLGVALAEWLHHGRGYAEQVVRNTKALGRALQERGVNVLYPDLGFSDSHTLLVQIPGAETAVHVCDRAGILCSACDLPWDVPGQPTGLRLGTQVLTRRGMIETQMDRVAEAFARVLIEHDDPERVRRELISPLASRFQGAAFSFDFHFPARDDWYDAPYRSLKTESAEAMMRRLIPFAGCTEAELEELIRRFDLIRLDEEQFLFQTGDPADSVYFVADGSVDLVDRSGPTDQVISTAGDGEHLGWPAAPAQRRPYAARAQAGTRVLRLTTTDFDDVLAKMPTVEEYFSRFEQPPTPTGERR